jgi:hypothetical protein
MPDERDTPEFSFIINFKRGEGDPRRIFDAASLLIEGFEAFEALDMAVGALSMHTWPPRSSSKTFVRDRSR